MRRDKRIFRRFQVNINRPVLFGLELLNFHFAFTNQTQGNGLNPPGRFRTGQFTPKNRRKREPPQIIQSTASHICRNKIVVYLARILNSFGNSVFGNFVENDSLNFLIF